MLSQKEKRTRITELQPEVGKFHPFLHTLLQRLPSIADVRYTHGSAEFGADFIVTKSDQTTGRQRYVGVVVKSGQITQSNLGEIKRQVEECQLVTRSVEHGQKRAHIAEVWVITNDTISNNAKEIIAPSFKGLTIELFDCDDLVGFVDKYAQFLWQDVPSALGQYLIDLDLRLAAEDEKSRLLGGVPQLPNIELEFSPLEIGEFRRSKSKKKKRDLIRLNEEIDSRAVIVVQGEMGAGKSHLLRHLGRQLASLELLATRKLVPVHVSYRSLINEFDGSISKCIDSSIGRASADIDPREHRIIVLIDGLDEVRPDDESSDSISELAEQIRNRVGTKGVITTRPRSLSKSRALISGDVRYVEIRPLTVGKIVQFIKDTVKERKLPSRLVDDVHNSHLFKQLPQNPIAAQLLTRIVMEGRDELPQTMSELYSKSMELMLGRWDEQKGLASQQEYDVARKVLYRLARTVVQNKLDVLAKSVASTELGDYLNDRNLIVDRRNVEARILERSGVMYVDDDAGQIGFRHRSFAEFLFAESFRDQADLGNGPHPFDPDWVNAFYFWIGSKRDCESELTRILATPCASIEERHVRMLCLPDYLMAGHMTPYTLTIKAVAKLLVEAAELYHDTLEGKIISPLASLSPMRLLWLVTFIIRNRYGYNFFARALEDAATEIHGTIAPPEIRATAMFFAAVTLNDLEHPAAFDLLLEEFKASELPFPVAIAVDAETQELEKSRITTALKSFGKKMKRLLTASAIGRRRIEELFRTPISSQLKIKSTDNS